MASWTDFGKVPEWNKEAGPTVLRLLNNKKEASADPRKRIVHGVPKDPWLNWV